MPKYSVKGTIPLNGKTETVDDVFIAKNEKEANRMFNAHVQNMKKAGKATVGKPVVIITLLAE
jgi:hypothetical protein